MRRFDDVSNGSIAVVMPSALTSRDRELLVMPTIISQFPIEFENCAVWEEFDGECSGCGVTLNRAHVTGCVTRPMKGVASIEAVGVCHECRLLTPFDYRLHDDMRMTGRNKDGWATWQAERSVFDRCLSFFKKLLNDE